MKLSFLGDITFIKVKQEWRRVLKIKFGNDRSTLMCLCCQLLRILLFDALADQSGVNVVTIFIRYIHISNHQFLPKGTCKGANVSFIAKDARRIELKNCQLKKALYQGQYNYKLKKLYLYITLYKLTLSSYQNNKNGTPSLRPLTSSFQQHQVYGYMKFNIYLWAKQERL